MDVPWTRKIARTECCVELLMRVHSCVCVCVYVVSACGADPCTAWAGDTVGEASRSSGGYGTGMSRAAPGSWEGRRWNNICSSVEVAVAGRGGSEPVDVARRSGVCERECVFSGTHSMDTFSLRGGGVQEISTHVWIHYSLCMCTHKDKIHMYAHLHQKMHIIVSLGDGS